MGSWGVGLYDDDAARRHGYFACYLVARLFPEAGVKPSLEDCAGAVIAGIDPRIPFVPADPAVKEGSVTRAEAKKLALEELGGLALDQPALRAAFPDPYLSLDRPSRSLAGLLRAYSEGPVIVTERSVPLEAPAIALSADGLGRGRAVDATDRLA